MVDDSKVAAAVLASIFKKQGLANVFTANSAAEALRILGADQPEALESQEEYDLIMLDIVMPDMDGIQTCSAIKSVERLRDVPVIMTTGLTDFESLRQAFEAGAMDFLTKPINEVELMARVRSALALKAEIDERKAHEKKLLEITARLSAANKELRRLSSLDGLTGLANRRLFDNTLEKEWRRGLRQQTRLAIVMMDIDHFKLYNDHYGHLAGDECLKQVAGALLTCLRRPGDLLARYGGEEFVALLPDTDKAGAMLLAKYARVAVEGLAIPHAGSPVAKVVTISLGVASSIPQSGQNATELVEAADKALYRAKGKGRNQVVAGSLQ